MIFRLNTCIKSLREQSAKLQRKSTQMVAIAAKPVVKNMECKSKKSAVKLTSFYKFFQFPFTGFQAE